MFHDEVSVETYVITWYLLVHLFLSNLQHSFSKQITLSFREFWLVSLPFMTSSVGTFLPLLIQGPQESQWFLTSQFDKSGGYTLISLIWPFSRALSQGEGDHRE